MPDLPTSHYSDLGLSRNRPAFNFRLTLGEIWYTRPHTEIKVLDFSLPHRERSQRSTPPARNLPPRNCSNYSPTTQKT